MSRSHGTRRFSASLLPDLRQPPSKNRLRRRIWTLLGLAFLGSVTLLLLVRSRQQADLAIVLHGIAIEERVDPLLAEAVMRAESGGNTRAVSRAKAYGLMQLRIDTAGEMAGRVVGIEDLFDPETNLELGCRYLRRMLDRYGDERLALMAYNAGPGNVDKWRRKSGDTETILKRYAFAETRGYVAKVLATRRVLSER